MKSRIPAKTILPPINQNMTERSGKNGVPAIIRPAFTTSNRPERHFLCTYIPAVNKNNTTAILQTGTAILVRNSSGIPVMVIPMRLSRAISPKQILWQICQDPKMLVKPDKLPSVPTVFSFTNSFDF